MLAVTTRILVCTEAQDMRRSFDRLALVAREVLGEDPQSGAIFVFTSKSRTRVKALWWDRSGYCLLYKRFHQAFFEIPHDATRIGSAIRIDGDALAALLRGVAGKKVIRERKSRNEDRGNVFQLSQCTRPRSPPTPPTANR